MKSGRVRTSYELKGVSVRDLWGRSIIVHEDEDDVGVGGFGGAGDGVESEEKKSEEGECSVEYSDQSGWMKFGD